MASKEEILELLNRKARTVNQLAEEFSVTRNSILVHLNKLESAGLVIRSAQSGSGQVGKPASLYEAAPGSEDENSRAYRPFAKLMTHALVAKLDEAERLELYRDMGNVMSEDVPTTKLKSLEDKIGAAVSIADELGAAVQLEETEKTFCIHSFTCPIAAVVRTDPCACSVLKVFFENVTGHTVREECVRSSKLFCRFVIEK